MFATRADREECGRCGQTGAVGEGRVEPSQGRWLCSRCCERLSGPVVQRASTDTGRKRGAHSIILRDEGGVTLPREPVVVVRVGGVDADPESTGREKRSVLGHVHRPFLPVHCDRVANLYAVELRVGDGVREKSGRGGVARSRPNGKSPASEDGEAHAWLGPEREPERARACDVCEAGRRAGWGVDGTYS